MEVISSFHQISNDGIIKGKSIGSGFQGFVFLANIPGYGEVAIKTFKENESFLQEISIISQLNDPNIVRFYGYLSNFEQKNWIVIYYTKKHYQVDINIKYLNK